MDLATFEIVIAVALGLLAAVALLSLLGVLLAFSLAVAMPALAGLAAPLRRRRWRDWHPPTDWLPDRDESDASRAVETARVPMRAVTLLSALEGDAQVRVIAAQVTSAESDRRPAYVPMTLVHARLGPGSRLALPPDDGCDVLVYVLAGQGFIGGPHRRPVCSGQLAVLEPDAPVIAATDADGPSPGLEVLALGELPVHHPVARGEAAVRRRAAQVDRRLDQLRVAELGNDRLGPLLGRTRRPGHPALAPACRVRAPHASVPRPRHAAPVEARPVEPTAEPLPAEPSAAGTGVGADAGS